MKMIAIILAGGYGKRLWPVTRDIAKPLLPIAGKRVMDYLMEKLVPIKDDLSEVVVLTNEKFKEQFEKWAKTWASLNIKVVSDGSSDEVEKPGAVGALGKIASDIQEDFFVIAGDCIYEDDLKDIVDFFKSKRLSVVGVYRAKDLDQVKRGSMVSLDEGDRIVEFVEKPEAPLTDLVGAVLYLFPLRIKDRLLEYERLNLSRDEPGRFIEWLHRIEDVYAYLLKGNVWDIGTPEGYTRVEEMLRRIQIG